MKKAVEKNLMRIKRTQQTKRTAAVLFYALTVAGGCGGNYSNEDLDFENAVPAPGQLTPQLSAQENANSSDLFKTTHKGVSDFNGLLDGVLGTIDTIRRYPATERTHTTRIWGPFRGDDPTSDLQFRITISKVPTPITVDNNYGYDLMYTVEVAPARSGPWSLFLSGTFSPRGSVRHGIGSLQVTTKDVRAAGLTIGKDNFGGIELLTIQYETLDTVRWNAHIEAHADPASDVSTAPEGDFSYEENRGTDDAVYNFEWRGGTDLFVQAARTTSRWRLSDAAGRADLTVTEGLASGMTATDCWGIDTVATYVHRDWDATQERGSSASCVFPSTP